MVVLYGNTAVIHPMCAIDEYAMIFRSWVWFSPPHPPIKIDNMAIVNIRFGLIDCEIWHSTDNGASFCHVSNSRPACSEMPWVTSGTQKWKGESPSFMARAMVIIVIATGLNIFVMVHWPEYRRLMMMAIISIMEAVACVRKYFVAASVARGLKFFINTGIIANRFISNPIQMSSQCELIITSMVTDITVMIRVV